jgi:GH15 family glucan-1,4-alpha-glucosidase
MNAIDDYGIIGDCRAAALVGRDGSLDWLCWPRFDSPAVFGALLDPAAGRWRIAPTGPFRSERRYLPETNVLETRFHAAGGRLLLTDLMPVASEPDKHRMLLPDHEIVRLATCEAGEVELEVCFEPRPCFGRGPVRLRPFGALGLRVEIPGGVMVLRSEMPLPAPVEARVQARAHLRAGQSLCFSLVHADEWPLVLPPLGDWSRQAISRTAAWWRGWAGGITYRGPERENVVRSALVLKLLGHAPSGAVIAAPTTSLPERVGGDLNWDYRYCWLRDASLTVRALSGLGFQDEAEAFVSWLLHSTRLTRPALRVLYDVYGKRPPRERRLDHLAGYRGSRPVRVGNQAIAQLQLDVYGEVVDATAQLARDGYALDRETQRMLSGFGRFVCQHWGDADEGIWEPRSGRRHNTHSRLLCWATLDRLLALHQEGRLPKAPAGLFAEHRARIRGEIETRAWNPTLQSYAAVLDSDVLDASLLLLPWYGFAEASSPRMRKTYARVRDALGARDGLLYRYRTGDSPGEGAFGVCGFWGAEYLALGGGTVAEAQAVFQRLCRFSNDLGLFAEEIDPATGAGLGNFPQGFTHVGLINAALTLARRLEGQPQREPPREPARQVPEARL